MDCLACLVFGVTIISAVREFGLKNDKDVSLTTAKGGVIGILGIGLIYLCLIWLGSTSLNKFALAANSGITLAQIFNFYLGTAGNALLAALTTLTCITTGMGLAAAFALDFHDRFPKYSYKFFLTINCLLSFIVANMVLDTIISWSKPVLILLYPLAITLVILGTISPLFKNDAIVYKTTTIFTIIPAIFDMINALPPTLNNFAIIKSINHFACQFIPFFNLGFGWISFSIIGFLIGFGIHLLRNKVRK